MAKLAGADTGFPMSWARILYFAKFSEKQHEIDNNLGHPTFLNFPGDFIM